MRASWFDKRQFYTEGTRTANPQAIQRLLEFSHAHYRNFLVLSNWGIWICEAHGLWSATSSLSRSSFWKGSRCAPGFLSSVFWIPKASRRRAKRRGESFVCFFLYQKLNLPFTEHVFSDKYQDLASDFSSSCLPGLIAHGCPRGEIREIPMAWHPELSSVVLDVCLLLCF